MTFSNNYIHSFIQLTVLCVTIVSVIGDLPPGTRRNTYLPPKPTNGGYTYPKPPVTFPTRTPTFPTVRPTPPITYPIGPTRPTPGSTFPTVPGTVYPTRPRPTPDYTGQPSGPNGNSIGPGVRELRTTFYTLSHYI